MHHTNAHTSQHKLLDPKERQHPVTLQLNTRARSTPAEHHLASPQRYRRSACRASARYPTTSPKPPVRPPPATYCADLRHPAATASASLQKNFSPSGRSMRTLS